MIKPSVTAEAEAVSGEFLTEAVLVNWYNSIELTDDFPMLLCLKPDSVIP